MNHGWRKTLVDYDGTAPEHARRSCHGKVRYASRGAAKGNRGRTASRAGGKALRPYRCQSCGGWHLSSSV